MAEIEKMKRTDMSAAEPQSAVGNPNQAAQPQNAIGSPSVSDKSPNLKAQSQQQRELTPPIMGFAPDTPSPNLKAQSQQTTTPATAPRATSQELYGTGTTVNATVTPRMNYVDTTEMERNLKAINDAAAKQATRQIDEATRTSADQARLAEAEAQAQYNEQKNQIALDEKMALDNAALYAEARGDRGGVGQAQYNAVQAAATRNRANVQAAQTKMASDVTRQIGDLRRQGEYQKADALLSLSQQYLSQVNQLKQWAAEMNMSVDQVNLSIAQWEKEFEQAEAQITGQYKGKDTLQKQQYDQQNAISIAGLTGDYGGQRTIAGQNLDITREQTSHNMAMDAADLGKQKLDAGIMPSADQLAALNMTTEEANSYIATQKAAQELDDAIAIAGITGEYNGQRTVAGQNADTSRMTAEANIGATVADLGFSTLEMGGMPSTDQLQAMGWSVTQARTYLDTQKAKEDAEANAENLTVTEKRGWTKLDAGMLPSADELKAMNISADAAQGYINAAKASASAVENRQAQAALADNGWTALDAGLMPSAAQLSAMGITSAAAKGYIDGINNAKSAEATADANSNLATQGWKAVNAGLMPSDAQLSAMGVKKTDVQSLLSSLNTNNTTTNNTSTQKTDDYDGLFTAAAKAQSPENYIASHYKEYGFNSATGLADAFEDYETESAESDAVSIGVIDPNTNRLIPRTDPRILNITYDSKGYAVYHLKDGRTLTDTHAGPVSPLSQGKPKAVTYLK